MLKYLLIIITSLLIIGCSSLPLPQNEYRGAEVKLHADYDIEQLDDPSGIVFKITSPAHEKVLFNLYKRDGTLLGTLYEGDGGIKVIDLDSLFSIYDFGFTKGDYILVLYGQRGKAAFNLTTLVSLIPFDHKQFRREMKVADSIDARSEIMPEPIGGIQIIQARNYPFEALKNNIEGRVKMACWINSSGDVTKVELVDGLGYGLDEIAMNVIKQTKFTPYRLNGKVADKVITISILFKLPEAE